MGENITIKNLTSFPVGWIKINGQGEVNLPPYTSVFVDRGEVVSKVQSGSELFNGENGDHAHPYIFIEDKDTPHWLTQWASSMAISEILICVIKLRNRCVVARSGAMYKSFRLPESKSSAIFRTFSGVVPLCNAAAFTPAKRNAAT